MFGDGHGVIGLDDLFVLRVHVMMRELKTIKNSPHREVGVQALCHANPRLAMGARGFAAIRRAFTLIELLVVISIIALLIAILLPVLSRTKESAARAECAANTRSLSQGVIVLSIDNKNRYRLDWQGFGGPDANRNKMSFYKDFNEVRQRWPGGPRVGTLANPTHWVNSSIFLDLVDVGVVLDTFQCPNRPPEFVFGRTVGPTTNVFPLEAPYPANLAYAETSYEMLGGRDVTTVQTNPTAQTRAWISPTSPDDPSDLPLNSCLMESGSYFPPPDTRIGSNFGHGPNGYIAVNGFVRPDETEAEGTNVSANDGSTQFVRTENLSGFRTSGGTGTANGWWGYVNSYDAVNPGYVAP